MPPVSKKQSRNNKSEKSKGKLVDKIRNKRTFMREGEILEEKTKIKVAALQNAPVVRVNSNKG